MGFCLRTWKVGLGSDPQNPKLVLAYTSIGLTYFTGRSGRLVGKHIAQHVPEIHLTFEPLVQSSSKGAVRAETVFFERTKIASAEPTVAKRPPFVSLPMKMFLRTAPSFS